MSQGRPGTKNSFSTPNAWRLPSLLNRRKLYKIWAVRLILLGFIAILCGPLLHSNWILGIGAAMMVMGCIAVGLLHRNQSKIPPMPRPGSHNSQLYK